MAATIVNSRPILHAIKELLENQSAQGVRSEACSYSAPPPGPIRGAPIAAEVTQDDESSAETLLIGSSQRGAES
jgi:hypothetical protein